MLGALESLYREQPVVVLGVHSNKFPAEEEVERIRHAMRRYGVSHPVVVDAKRRIWDSFTVRAWPTLVFLRPDGTVAASLPGEPQLTSLQSIVDEILEEARTDGSLGERFEPKPEPLPTGEVLAYPGNVLATPEGLAVTDTGHHRVLLVDSKDRTLRAVGAGEPGLTDGDSREARFRRPQGLALAGSTLFVADTGNHALRAIDLETGQVETLAGSGRLAHSVPQGLTDAGDVELRSPWAVEIVNGIVFLAMAGAHQIWAYAPDERTIAVFAGSGREAIDDGSLHEATFAQPTGLASDGQCLYVADSETSAVRSIDLVTARVKTLVGAGLFEFGDDDGPRERARLQHVQDVSTGPHGLLVADTFNDKIKHIDAVSGETSTWFETNGEIDPSEPSGLTQLAGGQVVVANTNAHNILVVDGDPRKAKVLPLTEYREKEF